MRIATINHRATLVAPLSDGLHGLDVAETSGEKFGTTVLELLDNWDRFRRWADGVVVDDTAPRVDAAALQAPVPNPRQIFAIGMNYADHADEVNISRPLAPSVFTKFSSSITGPNTTVELPSNSVDWEVEMVAVIGRAGRDIDVSQACEHIAGFTVGQDLSDREAQFLNQAPQFSMAKSYKNFTPTGPWITTHDAIENPANLTLRCSRGEQLLQEGTTAKLLFDIPTIVAYLSSIVELGPGDLIFTGTPDGVGFGRFPQEYLVPGDRLVSSIDGLGEIVQTFVTR